MNQKNVFATFLATSPAQPILRRIQKRIFRRGNDRVVSAIVLLGLGLAVSVQADVKLPGLFTDNMVLQQGQPVPVWGWAEEGENVIVEFHGHRVSAKTKGGKWTLKLPALKAGGPDTLTVAGKNRIELKNVLVVYLR